MTLGKKFTEDDTPARGPRMKNLSTLPPHSASSFEDDYNDGVEFDGDVDAEDSSFYEVESENESETGEGETLINM